MCLTQFYYVDISWFLVTGGCFEGGIVRLRLCEHFQAAFAGSQVCVGCGGARPLVRGGEPVAPRARGDARDDGRRGGPELIPVEGPEPIPATQRPSCLGRMESWGRNVAERAFAPKTVVHRTSAEYTILCIQRSRAEASDTFWLPNIV